MTTYTEEPQYCKRNMNLMRILHVTVGGSGLVGYLHWVAEELNLHGSRPAKSLNKRMSTVHFKSQPYHSDQRRPRRWIRKT